MGEKSQKRPYTVTEGGETEVDYADKGYMTGCENCQVFHLCNSSPPPYVSALVNFDRY